MEYHGYENFDPQLLAALEQKLLAIISSLGDNYFKWREQCMETVKGLYPNESERDTYALWYLFLGGTPPQSSLLHFDFEGEASIQKMIENFNLDL